MGRLDYEKDTTPPASPQEDKAVQEVVKESWWNEKVEEANTPSEDGK